MSKLSSKFAVLGMFALYASGTNAATYVANRTVGAGSISFSLTTDDTIGMLSVGNVVDYDITITNGANTINFKPGNASIYVFGSALSATLTDLNFDYAGAAGSFLVFNRGAGIGDHYCFETSGCSGVYNQAESFRVGQSGSFIGESRSGVQAIASVASVGGVPEPAAWALMMGGFGAAGVGMRYRRREVKARLA